jgi:hypothetical protein
VKRQETPASVIYRVDRALLVRRGVASIAVAVAGSVGMAWASRSPSGTALFALLTLGFMTVVIVGTARLEVELGVDDFRARTMFRSAQGATSEFMGLDSDQQWRRWTLVRRSDLSTIAIPWFTDHGLGPPDKQISEWLHARLAWVPPFGLKAIEQKSTMGAAQARATLTQAIRLDGSMFVKPAGRDREIAAAARAAWKYDYGNCREPLERLVLALPWTSHAFAFVLEALRKLGTDNTVVVLQQALAREACLVDTRNNMPIAWISWSRASPIPCRYNTPGTT